MSIVMSASELIEKLDERFGNYWSLCRTADGNWSIHIGKRARDCAGESVCSPKIEVALYNALAMRKVLSIPRVPGVRIRDLFSVKRMGSKWSIFYEHAFECGNFKTKREAEAAIEDIIKNEEAAREWWYRTYGPKIAGKVEGFDFQYV